MCVEHASDNIVSTLIYVESNEQKAKINHRKISV